jgi:hypothetical protein
MANLGANGPARVDAISRELYAKVSPEGARALLSMLFTKTQVEAMEGCSAWHAAPARPARAMSAAVTAAAAALISIDERRRSASAMKWIRAPKQGGKLAAVRRKVKRDTRKLAKMKAR